MCSFYTLSLISLSLFSLHRITLHQIIPTDDVSPFMYSTRSRLIRVSSLSHITSDSERLSQRVSETLYALKTWIISSRTSKSSNVRSTIFPPFKWRAWKSFAVRNVDVGRKCVREESHKVTSSVTSKQVSSVVQGELHDWAEYDYVCYRKSWRQQQCGWKTFFSSHFPISLPVCALITLLCNMKAEKEKFKIGQVCQSVKKKK